MTPTPQEKNMNKKYIWSVIALLLVLFLGISAYVYLLQPEPTIVSNEPLHPTELRLCNVGERVYTENGIPSCACEGLLDALGYCIDLK